MHVNLSWHKVEERFVVLVSVRSVDMLNAPRCLFKVLRHSSDTHAYPTRHATKGLFTIQNRLWEPHSTSWSHDYMELYSTSGN